MKVAIITKSVMKLFSWNKVFSEFQFNRPSDNNSSTESRPLVQDQFT